MFTKLWFWLSISAAASWGLEYVLSEKLMKHLPTTMVLAFTYFAGAIVFTVYSLVTDKDLFFRVPTMGKDVLLLLAGVSILWMVANYLIFASIKASNATLAGMVEVTYPVFALLFAWLLYKEVQLSPLALGGAALIFTGIGLILYATE